MTNWECKGSAPLKECIKPRHYTVVTDQCLSSIFISDRENIQEKCPMQTMSRDSYKPIPVEAGTWMIHEQFCPTVQRRCSSDDEPKLIAVRNKTNLFFAKHGCYLTTGRSEFLWYIPQINYEKTYLPSL